MSTTRAHRHAGALVTILLLLVVEAASAAHAPLASALYTASPAGSGRAKAATLPVPPAPTITSVGVQAGSCVVQLSWTAPPPGEQYTIQRTNGSTTTTIAGPTTTAGTATDTILVALLLGSPEYTTKATWAADPLWTITSPPATASGC
jgi:hypothetical protein